MADLPVIPAAGGGTPEPTPTPEVPAVDNDQAEWDAVHEELYPDTNKGAKDEPVEEKPAPKEDTEIEKPNEESGAGDDTKPGSGGEDEPKDAPKTDDTSRGDTSVRDSRLAARRAQAEVDSIRDTVRTALYPDAKETLTDRDGDPIETIDDVMKLIDPRTGEQFTEDSAGIWLLSAQQQFNKTKEAERERVERVANVTVDLQDQADLINSKYGEQLKDENLKARLWNAFEKTLVKENDIIVDAPMPLEEFYELYLEPIAKNAQAIAEQQQVSADEAERVRKEAEEKRSQRRSDRSDVYSTGKDPTPVDEEEDEWESAKTEQFGKRR